MITADALDRGRESFRRQGWGDAYAQLSAADHDTSLELGDLELLAVAAHLLGRDEELLAGRAVLDPHGVSAGDDGAPSSKRASQSTVV